MKKRAVRDALLDLAFVGLGCVLYGWSMVYLAEIPTIPGNLMGIAAVCNTLFGWPAGAVNLFLSVPTLILGTLVLGRRMLLYTVLAMTGLSVMTDVFAFLFPNGAEGSFLLLTVISGAIMGSACGLILYAGGSTGGTTVLARLFLKKHSKARISLGNLLILMDGVILLGGAVALRNASSFGYSLVFELVCCKTIDGIIMLLETALPRRW